MQPPMHGGTAASAAAAARPKSSRSKARSSRRAPRLDLSETSSTQTDSPSSGASSQKRKKDVSGPSLHSPRTRANSNNDEPRKRPAQPTSDGAPPPPHQHQHQHQHQQHHPQQLRFFPSQAEQHHHQQQQQLLREKQQQQRRFQQHQQQQRQQQQKLEESQSGASRKVIKSERERERRAAVRNLFLAISVELKLREKGDNSALDQTHVLAAAIKKLKEPDYLGPAGSMPASLSMNTHHGDTDASTDDDGLLRETARGTGRAGSSSMSSVSTDGTVSTMHTRKGMTAADLSCTPPSIKEFSTHPSDARHHRSYVHIKGFTPEEAHMPAAGMPSPVVTPLPASYDVGVYGDTHKWNADTSVARRNSLYGRRDSSGAYTDTLRVSGDSRRTSDASTTDFMQIFAEPFHSHMANGYADDSFVQFDNDVSRRDSSSYIKFEEVSPRSSYRCGSVADGSGPDSGSPPRKGRGRSSSCIAEGAALAMTMPPPVLYDLRLSSTTKASRHAAHAHAATAAGYARGQYADL
ncbi:Hypothetical Protein FCC1311_082432 [Hondaea fermentalgiana]|uniref:BHLH domain-containing protein n=1 Tax=Hondaea fermentalgiana TaxID=2315210 RepID=A0A2R5GQH0_9STRA|nr:Hypothetical Protein FCC1311_082432 [Hondaea fermentalgiana]|eukprot:GBG32018.1 Hypothetical Protein FCC1311_082432 [Hondaea fermentalgiana]